MLEQEDAALCTIAKGRHGTAVIACLATVQVLLGHGGAGKSISCQCEQAIR